MLSLGGFDSTLEIQSSSADFMIIAVYSLIPCILFALAAIMLAFYKLDEMMPEINRVIESRNAGEEVS